MKIYQNNIFTKQLIEKISQNPFETSNQPVSKQNNIPKIINNTLNLIQMSGGLLNADLSIYLISYTENKLIRIIESKTYSTTIKIYDNNNKLFYTHKLHTSKKLHKQLRTLLKRIYQDTINTNTKIIDPNELNIILKNKLTGNIL